MNVDVGIRGKKNETRQGCDNVKHERICKGRETTDHVPTLSQ